MKQLLTRLLFLFFLPIMNYSGSQVSISLTTSVTASTLTSYSTYAISVTQFTSTMMSKVFNGNLALPGWTAAGCGFTAFQFEANPGDQLTVSFRSDIPIDFYLMTLYQFQRVPVPTAFCNYYNALPIFPAMKYMSQQTSYSTSWTPVSSGQYYIVLFNLQNALATVSFSAGVTSVLAAASTIYATRASTVTVQSTRTSSVIEPQVHSSQTASLTITPQIMMLLSSALLAVIVAIMMMKRKRQTKLEKARLYEELLVTSLMPT